tara:strand:- start:3650 stop:4273 length:624 start_codon:yes stop_codon:yes gene_type:complete
MSYDGVDSLRVMQGVSSLRALERLARVDLGAMWVTGGIAPDHADIGRFICLHEQALSQTFFEALTRTVLARTGTSTACLAGDGTVIEAACSHYRLLKEEAVLARVSKARIGHQQALPEQQDETQQQLDRAHACEQVLDARIAARRRHGKRTDTVRVSLTEPERPPCSDRSVDAVLRRLIRPPSWPMRHASSWHTLWIPRARREWWVS